MRFRKTRSIVVLLLIFALLLSPIQVGIANGETITNKNGCQYDGALVALSEIGSTRIDATLNTTTSKKVLFVSDGLRRTYIPKTQLATTPSPSNPIYETFKIDQNVTNSHRQVGEVGQLLYISPFDEHGRRFVRVTTKAHGTIELHQGITEISPIYCEVRCLQAVKFDFQWKQSVATSSIPRKTLSQIIYKQIDPTNPAQRMKIVSFYQQAERHKDAIEELQQIIADFPEMDDLSRSIDMLRTAYANRIIAEVRTRMDAGQHRLAYSMIENFPTEDIASAILGEVLDIKTTYLRDVSQVEELQGMLKSVSEEVAKSTEFTEEQGAAFNSIFQEMNEDLNLNNVSRLSAFRRFYDDLSKTADQKVAFAVSGWLLGGDAADGNMAVALSQVRVRDLVYEYFATANAQRRREILELLDSMEGSQPESLARMIEQLLPVKPVPQEFEEDIPGFYRITVPGVEEGKDFEYVVQLPPEYDPYRKYPCVVTLGDGMTPSQQVAWWAGGYDPKNGMRLGQASRLGYVVISPRWQNDNDLIYRYSEVEHAAVLFSVQDAIRRFSIDNDRVFLSGHSEGGDAAWDIGLAHPDLWAGVIPIVATADKYVQRYWENGRHQLGFYFVHGEYDNRRFDANAAQWNRYFTHHGYDVTISEYLGRGHEHFYEDIHRIFDWMKFHRRNFFPKEFSCLSLRPTDNFFWYVESSDFLPTNVILPPEWPKQGIKDAETSVRFTNDNIFTVNTAGQDATIWLAPELVDFSKPMTYRVNHSRPNRDVMIQPSREVMLEDVRTRGDRQNPFWAKIVVDQAR